MNSIVGSSFKIVFDKKSICGSREQCIRPTQKMHTCVYFPFQCNPNVHLTHKNYIIKNHETYTNVIVNNIINLKSKINICGTNRKM